MKQTQVCLTVEKQKNYGQSKTTITTHLCKSHHSHVKHSYFLFFIFLCLLIKKNKYLFFLFLFIIFVLFFCFLWGGGGGRNCSGLTSAELFYVCILLQINIDAATIAYYTKNGVLFYKEKPTLQSLSEQDKATHTIIHTITHNGITSIILSVLYACCILTQTTINKFVPYIRKNKLYGCSDIKLLHLSFYNMQRHRMYMLLHCHRKPTR